jgi:hypothetical protein
MFAAIRRFAEDEPSRQVIVSERSLRHCGIRNERKEKESV